MPQSIPLNTGSWDIELDSNGNLSLVEEDYSIAQDVACAIRTFLGECWYDVTLGLPYFGSILGQRPPASLITSLVTDAALTVATVTSVTVIRLVLNQQRVLTGTVIVVSTSSTQPLVVSF